MAYSDNIIYQVKKGQVIYDIKDAIAAAAINVLNGDDKTEGSVAKAKADAIAAAAADATTKSNAAEAAAKSYADGLASNYDASGAAATAEQNAKDYADGLASNYDVKGAATTAENNAKADATTKADAALAAAKTYADSKVSTAKSELIGANTDLVNADTIHGAKNYAKGLVDALLGEDSASTTLATLKQVIAELQDPANTGGIAETFVDTVKADLAGLTKDDGNGGTTHATVKEYVDNKETAINATITANEQTTAAALTNLNNRVDAISGNGGAIQTAIAALDANLTQTAGADGLALSLTEVDGVVTAISGSIAAGTYDEGGAAATAETNAKAYADNKVAALDATVSQTAGADGLALRLTEVDGVVTAISGSIAADTYDAHGAANTAKTQVIGTSNDAKTADTIYGAKAYADAAVANASATIENGVLILS